MNPVEEKYREMLEESLPRHCPDCGPEAGYMDPILFLGVHPDGYVCNECRVFYGRIAGQLKKLAVVI